MGRGEGTWAAPGDVGARGRGCGREGGDVGVKGGDVGARGGGNGLAWGDVGRVEGTGRAGGRTWACGEGVGTQGGHGRVGLEEIWATFLSEGKPISFPAPGVVSLYSGMLAAQRPRQGHRRVCNELLV